jgi:hypothetical protein
MKTRQTSIRLSPVTDRQIETLTGRGYGSFSDVVRTGVDIVYREEMKMDTVMFEVQHTGSPEPGAWKTFCVVDTLQHADGIVSEEMDKMARRCGRCAWDDRFRVVPTQDTTIVYTHMCSGHIRQDGHNQWCEDMATARVSHPWPAGQPRPEETIPEGWYSEGQCAACREKERAAEAILTGDC